MQHWRYLEGISGKFRDTSLGFAVAVVAFSAQKSIFVTLGLIVGGLRIFELVVYQVSVLLFDE